MTQVPVFEAEHFFPCQTLLGEGEHISPRGCLADRQALISQGFFGIPRLSCCTGLTLTMPRSTREPKLVHGTYKY
jgi:hypothetical protein